MISMWQRGVMRIGKRTSGIGPTKQLGSCNETLTEENVAMPRSRKPASTNQIIHANEGIPFSTFSGYLKSIRLDLLDDQARIAVKWAFACFFEEPSVNLHSTQFFEKAWGQGKSFPSQSAYNYRRFGGDSTLPRQRYYSIASDRAGNDSGTLLNELLAYTDHAKSGAIVPFDGGDDAERERVARTFNLAASTFSKTAIHVLFINDDAATLTPIFRSGMLRSNINSLAIVTFPYVVDDIAIDRFVDLRLPLTQAWFAQKILSGLPNVHYSYGEVFTNRLYVGAFRPAKDVGSENVGSEDVGSKDVGSKDVGSKDVGEALIHAPSSEWDGSHTQAEEEFVGLYPFITYPERGGSPITEALGVWLRQIGANDLVFPSARNDIEVTIRNGKLVGSGGWNFVDYRGAPPPTHPIRMIYEPDSWTYAPRFSQAQLAKGQDQYSGSWRISGRADDSYKDFRHQQLTLSRMMLRHYREAQESKDGGQILKQFGADALRRAVNSMEDDAIKVIDNEYARGYYQECIEGANQLLSMGVNDFRLLFRLGMAYAKIGRHEDAISAFQKSRDFGLTRSEPISNTGNSFMALGRFGEASEAYAAALKINPSDAVARANISVADMLNHRLKGSGAHDQ
jgi:hypothetical protein